MSTGCRFSYDLNGSESHPVILFLHGFMGCKGDWTEVANGLGDGFRTMTVDLPGHGDTEVLNEGCYRMEGCANELVKLLDSLNVERCHLVGYSMGGRLGFHLLVHHPRRFERAVIESASPGLLSRTERRDRITHDLSLAMQLKSEGLEAFLSRWYSQPMFSRLRRDHARFAGILERRRRNDPMKLARSLRFMGSGAMEPLWSQLHTISHPLLLLKGEHDTKFRAIARGMAAEIPNVQISVVPNAGHTVHFEQPDAYIKLVGNFLKDTRQVPHVIA
jgi:2-succinyl-6-hydroxy-2,4-cyclohexadiene-1-carboxylate synthase